MAMCLGPEVVDALLLGAADRRRQLQDFPILGDVWTCYAQKPPPAIPPDLLILPTWEKSAVEVADLLEKPGEAQNDANRSRGVAYLNDLVVATLDLVDIEATILPATQWWDNVEDHWDAGLVGSLRDRIEDELKSTLGSAASTTIFGKKNCKKKSSEPQRAFVQQAARLGLLMGVFLAARDHVEPKGDKGAKGAADTFEKAVERLGHKAIVDAGEASVLRVRAAYEKFKEVAESDTERREWKGAIFNVALNRKAETSVAESVAAIKGDAARSVFSISCKSVAWAVLDSGIDTFHPGFVDHAREAKQAPAPPRPPGSLPWRPHRIKGTFDFRRIRAIIAVKPATLTAVEADIAKYSALKSGEIKRYLEGLIEDRTRRLPIDWRKIEPLITVDTGPQRKEQPAPPNPHGTHVAGIIGADWREDDHNPAKTPLEGVCPDIQLYDFRVLGSDLGDSEFAVSAALQFIRFYNEQGGYPRINGVNMSLAIRHNVRNYACGRTSVCLEAEALVSNGVTVVAAAGNRGYQQYQLADATTFEGYAASSITDPGNAEGVITVGSTHRHWPHTYGVSFFSSRGPTGDGRMKPDLLAPGEKIVSTVPGAAQDQMDGTSMAAPHVSGACALLMARHEELKGQPTRIKQILCESATDLKRERSFQGHGMVDVLRAIQSI
ncbi:MAG TPA: S8 family peptidase [Allosphingosinicella sp.]|jgi:subtilisin family serine protease